MKKQDGKHAGSKYANTQLRTSGLAKSAFGGGGANYSQIGQDLTESSAITLLVQLSMPKKTIGVVFAVHHVIDT